MKKSEIHILIIDDDASIRAVLSEAVKKFGYKVSAVGKPEEALALVKIKTIQLALVDMMLPRMNGLELVKELRMTPFSDSAVVFISGIFRDPAFMQETVKSSKAIDYLVKPLELKTLKTVIDQAIAPFLESSQVRIQDLLTKPSSTARERAKAVESLEEVSGYELPAILSILMHEESSGYLNIADSAGDVFGLTLMKGDIVQIDSATSRETLRKVLLDKNVMTEEEINSVPPARLKGDAIKNLIEDSWLSPHMSLDIKAEQVKIELQKRITADQLRLNYVEDRIRNNDDKVTFIHLMPLWHELALKFLPLKYLEDFYKELNEFPLKKGPEFRLGDSFLSLPLVGASMKLVDLLNKNMTLDEIQADSQLAMEQLLRTTHLMALSRWIVFDDVRKENSVLDRFKHMEKMYEEVKSKNPFEIFAYFGAGLDPKKQDVERIFKEFAKSNHPDLLPQQADKSLRDAVTMLFSLISEAHDILMSDEKRKKAKDQLKQKEFEKQLKAESLAEEGFQSLLRGHFSKAIEALNGAQELFTTHRVTILVYWAKLKAGRVPASKLKEFTDAMELIPHTERRNAEYAFTMGLLKRAQGDMEGASVQFDKALAINPQFLEARRELGELKDSNKKSFDLLNGDISSIVSNLFKKKIG